MRDKNNYLLEGHFFETVFVFISYPPGCAGKKIGALKKDLLDLALRYSEKSKQHD